MTYQCIVGAWLLLSKALLCVVYCAAALQEDVRESRVYRDLAKEQERSMGMGSKYRLQRQTIFCSATIPQRYVLSAALCGCERIATVVLR